MKQGEAPEAKNDGQRSKCSECAKIYPSKHDLKVHQRLKHDSGSVE